MPASAPSFPHLTDEHVPTNSPLWDKVLEVARGDVPEMTVGDRTITAPSGYVWPSPPASAWAVKQYNGFGGGWRKRAAADRYQRRALRILLAGGVVTSRLAEEHEWMAQLQWRKLAHPIHDGGEHRMWDAGERVIVAGFANELTKRVEKTLAGELAPGPYAELAEWLDRNFRVDSAKTPRGQKGLKLEGQRFLQLIRAYSHSGATLYPAAREGVAERWRQLKPHLGDLVRYFTAEGDAARGKKEVMTELRGSKATYLNRSNLSNDRFEKYAKGIDRVLSSLKGWRSKALSGNLKVAFVGARALRAQGKYKREEDLMLVRATPKVLKRTSGYATLDYILVHELGHRYERFHGTGVDFDQAKWRTTRYSWTESMAGSEAFAELFAIGHFRLTGNWDAAIVDRFEQVMAGRIKE